MRVSTTPQLMDKLSWIVVIACSFLLLWWCDEQKKLGEQIRKARAAEEAKKPEGGAATGEPGDPANPTPGNPAVPAVPAVPEVETVEETLTNEVGEWVFSNIGGGIARVVLDSHNLKHHRSGDEAPEGGFERVIVNEYSQMPIGALSRGVGEFEKLSYTMTKKSETEIVMQATSPAGLQVSKTYSLTSPDDPGRGHIVHLEMSVKYVGEAGNFSAEDYYLYSGSAAALHPKEWKQQTGFTYMRGGKDKYRDVNYFKKEKRRKYTQNLEEFRWGGVMNQFFTTNICTTEEYDTGIWATRFPVKLRGFEEESDGLYAVHGAVGLPPFALDPGAEEKWSFEIYAGPKHYRTLHALDYDRDELMGFDRVPLFGWMAKPFSKLLSSLMDWLHSLIGNYGWAIVAITLIIRLAIWPLHIKSQRTMKRMSLLQPKMKELKEKYPDNPQKMNQEMMGLYRDYGVNPFGGCLPILLQMPIFFGFFSMLRSAVELRHQPWLAWVNDLSMPDTVVRIGGFPLNILPILMGITMVLQMRMTPTTGDKMQRRIFMLMPVIFLVFCYGFASALALYWTAQNVISIGQTWLLRNRQEIELVKRKRAPRQMPGRKGAPSFNPTEKKTPKRKQIRTGGGKGKKKR